MAHSFKRIDRVFIQQENSVLGTGTPCDPGAIFPIALPSCSTVDLGIIRVPVRRHNSESAYYLDACINWQMTSTNASPCGMAQVCFEFLRDDAVICRAYDTIARPCGSTDAITTYGTLNLQYLDKKDTCSCSSSYHCHGSSASVLTFKVRANNILLDSALTTAAVGAVCFRVEELRCGN